MTDAEIMASYQHLETVQGIVRDLSKSRAWPERLQAAKAELAKRLSQDTKQHEHNSHTGI